MSEEERAGLAALAEAAEGRAGLQAAARWIERQLEADVRRQVSATSYRARTRVRG